MPGGAGFGYEQFVAKQQDHSARAAEIRMIDYNTRQNKPVSG